MSTIIAFDEATHSYSHEGVHVPSVTQILQDTGAIDTSYYAGDTARNRGTIIAAATQLVDAGRLNEKLLEGQGLLGYVRQYQKFLRESGVRVVCSERIVYNERLHYAGRIDRVVVASNDASACGAVVVDIKTGSQERWHCLQTAAYLLAADTFDGRYVAVARACLYLAPERYRFVAHQDSDDYAAWRGIVAYYHWRNR